MAILSTQLKGLLSLSAFRKQMSASMIVPVLKEYFTDKEINNFQTKMALNIDFINKDIVDYEKVDFIKTSLKFNKIFEILGLVKYVGISGSLAARKFIDGEDLDLFFVVANDTAWIYRGFLKMFLGKKGRLYETDDVKDSLCVNFIIEERATHFTSDIFTFHELLHLVNIYNNQYKQRMIAVNKWIKQEYGVDVNSNKVPNIKRNILLMPINYIAYQLQVLFMKLMKHNPSLERIRLNFKKGKIAFYPEDFSNFVKKNYEKEYNLLLNKLPTSSTSTTDSTTTKTTTTTKSSSTSKATT